MSICSYCGQKLGWFEKAHDTCVREYEQKAIAAERARSVRQQEEARRREYQAWRTRHGALVEKFLDIAERKVSLLDEYGDENWDILRKEIETVVLKTAKADGEDIISIRSLLFRDLKGADLDRALRAGRRSRTGGAWLQSFAKYSSISDYLESEFRSFHEKRKVVSVVGQDFSTLTGVDFEIYVAKLLKEAGFEDISGTPMTGDQGADLIAKRDGRIIAIQAKGYAGPVGNGAVQEIVSALKFYKADAAWVVTNSTFTQSARSLAQANNVRLIDGHDLKNFVHVVQKI